MNDVSRNSEGLISIPPGVIVERHEKRTADFIATTLKNDVIFIRPTRRVGSKSPDITMGGIDWEIKCPQGASSRTIENNLRQALRQSPNIIMDLRRMSKRQPEEKIIQNIYQRFNKTKSIKNILVITRQDDYIEYKR